MRHWGNVYYAPPITRVHLLFVYSYYPIGCFNHWLGSVWFDRQTAGRAVNNLIALTTSDTTGSIKSTVSVFSDNGRHADDSSVKAAEGASSDATRLAVVTGEQWSYSPYCPYVRWNYRGTERHSNQVGSAWAAMNKWWGGWAQIGREAGLWCHSQESPTPVCPLCPCVPGHGCQLH